MDLVSRLVQDSQRGRGLGGARGRGGVGGGLVGSGGLAPRKKMRSVFGTCMVSGIRRREKVRERDRGSSRGEVVVMVREWRGGWWGHVSEGSTGPR